MSGTCEPELLKKKLDKHVDICPRYTNIR